MVPDKLRLGFKRPIRRQGERITALQGGRHTRPFNVYADIVVRGGIPAVPGAHQDAVEIPALRSDMSPVAAEARAADIDVTDGKSVPAERLALYVAIHIGMGDEQADTVVMAVFRFPAE